MSENKEVKTKEELRLLNESEIYTFRYDNFCVLRIVLDCPDWGEKIGLSSKIYDKITLGQLEKKIKYMKNILLNQINCINKGIEKRNKKLQKRMNKKLVCN